MMTTTTTMTGGHVTTWWCHFRFRRSLGAVGGRSGWGLPRRYSWCTGLDRRSLKIVRRLSSKLSCQLPAAFCQQLGCSMHWVIAVELLYGNVWIAGGREGSGERFGGVQPLYCFLNPPTHCQIMFWGVSYILYVYIYMIYITILVGFRPSKIQPPMQLIFHNSNTASRYLQRTYFVRNSTVAEKPCGAACYLKRRYAQNSQNYSLYI